LLNVRVARPPDATELCREALQERVAGGRLAAAAMTSRSPLSDRARGMGAVQGGQQEVSHVAVEPDGAQAIPGEAEMCEYETRSLVVMLTSKISGSILPRSGKSSARLPEGAGPSFALLAARG
jgi:hypothetical protein